MLSENYLQQGLVGLSRSTHNWGQAHYGAAVIAAYFFCRENQLDGRTLKAVKGQTDQLIAKHQELFVPFAPQEPHPELLPKILTALNENIGELHGIGHNIIFATSALKAFTIVPDMLTPAIVGAICQLIRLFSTLGRGGPFPGWDDIQQVTVQDEDHIPPYDSEETMCRTTLDELLQFKRIYYGLHQGVVGHLITSAEALIELARLRYTDLAHKGHRAHHIYIKLARKSHDSDFVEENFVLATPSPHHPLTHAYWESDLERDDHWLYGHRIKFVYSFYKLMRILGFPENMTMYEKQLAYLLGERPKPSSGVPGAEVS